MYDCVPADLIGQKKTLNPRSWNYGCLWAAMVTLGTEPKASVRTSSALSFELSL